MYRVSHNNKTVGLFWKKKEAEELIAKNPEYTLDVVYGVAYDFYSIKDFEEAMKK